MSSDATTIERATANIAPRLSVPDAATAVEFYKAAFGAEVQERVEDESGSLVIARLTIGGAGFWVQEDGDTNPRALADRSPVRIILTVKDPDSVFTRAVRAGATEIAPMYEGNGWRIGRIADPSGHHWEVGRPLAS
jgi:PhnB protein